MSIDPPGTSKIPFTFLSKRHKLLERSIYHLEQTVPQHRGLWPKSVPPACAVPLVSHWLTPVTKEEPGLAQNNPKTSWGTGTQSCAPGLAPPGFDSSEEWQSPEHSSWMCTIITHQPPETADLSLNTHCYVHEHPPFTNTSAVFLVFFLSFTKRFNTCIRLKSEVLPIDLYFL